MVVERVLGGFGGSRNYLHQNEREKLKQENTRIDNYIQRDKNKNKQRNTDTNNKIQIYIDTKVQRYRDTNNKDTKTQRKKNQ